MEGIEGGDEIILSPQELQILSELDRYAHFFHYFNNMNTLMFLKIKILHLSIC